MNLFGNRVAAVETGWMRSGWSWPGLNLMCVLTKKSLDTGPADRYHMDMKADIRRCLELKVSSRPPGAGEGPGPGRSSPCPPWDPGRPASKTGRRQNSVSVPPHLRCFVTSAPGNGHSTFGPFPSPAASGQPMLPAQGEPGHTTTLPPTLQILSATS